MKIIPGLFRIIGLLIFLPAVSDAQTINNKREVLLMDAGWRFAFGHPYDPKKDYNNGTGYFSYITKAGYGDGAAAANFDDRSWRKLDLPHDWAVEQPFDVNASFSHGFKAIGRNFPDRSVGWYRKSIRIPASDLGRKITVMFDGVFRNSIVWVNGHYLGTEPGGYNSFEYDITDYLNYGGDNVIAVRVDVTMEEGWYYEGAGIYRHVWLKKTSPIHVATNGTFVTTKSVGNNSTVHITTSLVNESREQALINLKQEVIDSTGKIVSTSTINDIRLPILQNKELQSEVIIRDPIHWDIDRPYMYKLVTTITSGGAEQDVYETPFGIREIRFDAKEGFYLNGRNVKLKGTNNHQDHAGVGTAMPDGLQYFRIKALKEMGSNAYRCSHHPPTPELLEACDRLGMLVIDEHRLMGTTAGHLNEMKRMIIRDRNHPSIISWSIGNEEWGIENSITGERIATTMQQYVKTLDTTRTTTAGVSGGFRSGISSVLEVMGYNYMGNGDIEAHHKLFPDQPAMGTEEGSTFATRGVYETDNDKHYQAAYDKKPRPSFYSIEEGWKFYAERPYLAGMFIWTGFDYRGEPTPYGWPSVTSYFGMMDLCGFPKDNVYYLRSWWLNKPVLHILPHWNWPGKEGKEIDVWVYSNFDEVELFLNKKSQGRKKMETNGHLEWKVKYAPGTLEAVGFNDRKKMMSSRVTTTSPAVEIVLSADKKMVDANGEDIAMVTVELNDKNKNHVPTANDEIFFEIEGPGKILGVGNGDPTSLENEKFIESIRTIEVKDLKELAVENIDGGKEINEEFNDASWKPAFQGRTHLDSTKAYVYRGSFDLPKGYEEAEITFFYKSLGTRQGIYLNGKPIAVDLPQGNPGNEFKLDKSMLKEGRNSIAITSIPIRKKNPWDNINTEAGTIQLLTKAEGYKRKLFNGYAQVIIQSTKNAGEIKLKATANNLKPAILQVKSNPSKVRPGVD